MRTRLTIKATYGSRPLNFKRHTTYVDYPHISVVFKNPDTGIMDGGRHNFLIDTGASISIVNASSKGFLDKLKPIDEISIVYGAGGSAKCAVYEVIMVMNGQDVPIKVAYDTRCHCQVLGHYDFFEKMDYNLFHTTEKKTVLVKDR